MGAIVTQPLDVLKTRLQSSVKTESVVRGQSELFFTKTLNSLRYTFAKEGTQGLFVGLIPNLVGVVPSRYLKNCRISI